MTIDFEHTWYWEHWKLINQRSGAMTLVCWGQETRISQLEDNGIDRLLDVDLSKNTGKTVWPVI